MILICDDDAAILSSLTLVLNRAGYETAGVSSPRAAVEFVKTTRVDLILMDMNYTSSTDGEEGLTLLQQVKVYAPQVPVILMTAWGTISLAVRGIQAGAFDFITKPWHNLALLNTIRTALELSQEKAIQPSAEEGKTPAANAADFSKIVGRSPLLLNVFNTIGRIARTNASVLITGESGTGKELIAEAIHRHSNRKEKPFVKVNLGGISQSLFESEMFGHKKGAFTDAHYDRTGRFETADKGSIFLDEIGELDPVSQVKLLRVLQDQTFEPLGESRSRKVDVRIISATNRNLPEMVAEGTFREDLFYRINLITIQVPALRERPDDIPLLADHFVRQQAEANGLGEISIAAEGMQFLKQLPYPGNIRELKNLVERTLLVSGKGTLTDRDFKAQYTELPGDKSAVLHTGLTLDELEKKLILRTQELYGGNHSKMAAALGLSRQTLYRRMEKYGIADKK